MISGQNSVIDFQAMPFVIFSDPEVAYTGLTEKEAKEKDTKQYPVVFHSSKW